MRSTTRLPSCNHCFNRDDQLDLSILGISSLVHLLVHVQILVRNVILVQLSCVDFS